MKKLLLTIFGLLSLGGIAYAAPSVIYQRTILPEVTSTYDLGSASLLWNNLYLGGNSSGSTRCLQILSTGQVGAATAACGSGGGGSGGGTWATTTSNVTNELINYSLNNTDIVTVGNTSTTSAKFYFDPNIPRVFFTGNVGLGTTTPSSVLSVVGSAYITGDLRAANIVATSTLTVSGNTTLAQATSTNFAITGITSTLLKTTSGGSVVPAISNTDYLATVTADSPLSGSGTTGSHLTISTAGTWSGNAGTASALAANGTNCSAGNYPLGVDASGNAESCTAASTGTVTAVSVASANGFTGSSSGGATPALTLTTSISGVLKGNGTAISAASNGTDYSLITANTCSAGQHFNQATAAGVFSCTADSGGGGAAAGTWSTTTSTVTGQLINYPNNNTDIVTVGNTATTTAKYYFDPNTGNTHLPLGQGNLMMNDAGLVISSTSPTFVAITATSTTATSTIYGNLTIGGNNLIVGGRGNLVFGSTTDGGKSYIGTIGGNGSFAGGAQNPGTSATSFILASSSGAFAFGMADNSVSGGGEIFASSSGSFALGYAQGTGSFGLISAGSNKGNLAMGYTQAGQILSTGIGSLAFGASVFNSISSVNSGSFAGGYAVGGNITAAGLGSFAFGNNIQALADYSTAIGNSFTNNNSNTFMVGYSSVPTFIVTATSTGIGTTTPFKKFSVSGESWVTSTSTASVFVATSTTATSTAANGWNLTGGCFAVNGTCVGGGSGTPGGSNTQVQYNNSGAFGGDSGLTYTQSAARLTMTYASSTAISATTFCFTGDTCRTSWGGGFVGATSTISLIDTGSSVAPATTTAVFTSGQSVQIWAECSMRESGNNQNFFLDVKNPGGGTTTIAAGNFNNANASEVENMINLSGLYTPTTTGPSFIALDGSKGTNAITGCRWPNIMYSNNTGSSGGGSGTVTTLTAGTNITFSSGATCTTSCTINSSAGGTFPFTTQNWGTVNSNATSTLIGFLGGFYTTASSTMAATSTFSAAVVTPEWGGTSTTSPIVIDWGKGPSQLISLGTSAVTINMTNYTAGSHLDLVVCNPKSTAGTITWGAGIIFPGSFPVGQTTSANNCDDWAFKATIASSTAETGTPTTVVWFTGVNSGY